MTGFDAADIIARWERADTERARQGCNEPIPVPDELKRVMAFDFDFLPTSIAPWVGDISERMQCPPDFIGISAMVGLGAAIGRKIGIRPQTRTDWLEVPNLWGCIVGRPGAMKSPAMAEALKPLHRLEIDVHAAYEGALKDYIHARELHELRKHDAQARAKADLKKGLEVDKLSWRTLMNRKHQRHGGMLSTTQATKRSDKSLPTIPTEYWLFGTSWSRC